MACCTTVFLTIVIYRFLSKAYSFKYDNIFWVYVPVIKIKQFEQIPDLFSTDVVFYSDYEVFGDKGNYTELNV